MEDYRLLWIAGFVVVGLIALGLAILLALLAFRGAVLLLRMAAEQGFVGLAAFVAAWVFMLPVMAIISAIIGFLDARADMTGPSDVRSERRLSGLRRKSRAVPPAGRRERYLWANRLPPYDQDDA